VLTLNTSVYNQSFAYLNNSIASTLSLLTSLNIITIFTNVSLKSNMLLYYDESKKLKDKEFNNVVFEQIAQEIIERKTTNISIISKNIKFKNMFVKQVAIRVKKITSLNKREKQIEIIYVISCFRKFLILIAKTNFSKSLIFNVFFLLSLIKTSVVLIVLSLKLINEQQFNRVKHYNCKSNFIYDINHKLRIN